MIIEIGKIYKTREGKRIKALFLTGKGGKWEVRTQDADTGVLGYRSLKGRFHSHPHKSDLIETIED